jgi:hypothetical protein
MLTIAGGEEIDFDRLPEYQPLPYWSRIVATTVLVVSFLVLLLRPRARRSEPTPAA